MINCVCGCKKYTSSYRNYYEVTTDGLTIRTNKKMLVLTCSDCDIKRQGKLPFKNKQELISYYNNYPPSNKSYQVKGKQHDLKIAKERFKQCELDFNIDDKIIDVGSGSGAFVHFLKTKSFEVCGCELSNYSSSFDIKDVYKNDFEDIGFPTDKFDKVFCYDVIEHILNPVSFIKELHRVTNQEGNCIIEFPDFFSKDGKHHWKLIEHIWFFTVDQFSKIVKDIGFKIIKIDNPISGKLLFVLEKKKEKRISILVPPGIGDSYWSITKLESFIEKNKIGIPDIYVACNKVKQHDGHKRAFPFIEMFPFLHSSSEAIGNMKNEKHKQIWREAYAQKRRTIFNKVMGCDYFISYNGHLRFGERMEDIDPDLKTNWYPKMFESLEQKRYKNQILKHYGKYILCYFPCQGTYKYWTQEFNLSKIVSSIQNICRLTKTFPIFVGAKWDAEEETLTRITQNSGRCLDLRGKTSVEQLFGLIKGSSLIFGFPSGLTIMATVLKAKTLMLWNKYYHEDFVKHSCPPDTWDKNYFVFNTKNLTEREVITKGVNIINEINVNPKSIIIDTFFTSINANMPDNVKPLPNYEAMFHEQNKLKEHIKTKKRKIVILTILKEDSEYTFDHLKRLKKMLKKNIKLPYKLICISNIKINKKICESIYIEKDFNKTILFKKGLIKSDYLIYIDLNCEIKNNIDDLLSTDFSFAALSAWHLKNKKRGYCVTSLMAWKNNESIEYLYDSNSEFFNKVGEQQYFKFKLEQLGIGFHPLQTNISGIVNNKIYKKNKKEDVKIIFFYGNNYLNKLKEI